MRSGVELLCILSGIFVTVACLSTSALADKRVALVIGNGEYRSLAKLADAPNNATDIASALRKLGFDVVDAENLDRRSMEEAIHQFGQKLSSANIALFFYSGHGFQVGDRNYLAPVETKLEQPADLARDTIEVATVIAQMQADDRVGLVFLDTSRQDPFPSISKKSKSSGLNVLEAPNGIMVTYATAPGGIALSAESHRNSYFTTALLHHIADAGVDIATVMRRVLKEVAAVTKGRQIPSFFCSDPSGEISLRTVRD